MHKFGLIPRNWLLNTVYSEQEVVTRLLSQPLCLYSLLFLSELIILFLHFFQYLIIASLVQSVFQFR
ncbi:hypothetical protein DQM18_11205 [Enterococcus faecium]|nr:hypothetical protein DQM18_11205 [Enterococcus faecium]